MNNSLNKIEQTFSWSNAVCKKVSNFQWLEIVIIINIFSYQSNCFIWKELNIYSLQKKKHWKYFNCIQTTFFTLPVKNSLKL